MNHIFPFTHERRKAQPPRDVKATRILWLAVGFWTLSAFSSVGWDIFQEYRQMREVALAEARSHLRKDMAFRSWISSHGGLYARVNDTTIPDKDISFIPDRDVRTPDGEELTLIHPVNGVGQINDYFSEPFDITSRTVSFRRYDHGDKPDSFERDALKSFERGESETFAFTEMDGQPVLRLIVPAYAEEHCLKCHAREGFRTGDILGGVSITVPLTPRLISMQEHVFKEMGVYAVLWALGLLGIGFWWRRFGNWLRFRRYADIELLEREELFRGLSEQSPNMIFISLYGTVVYANEEFFRVTGCTHVDLSLQNVDLKNFLAPASWESVLDYFRKQLGGEKERPLECTLINASGVEIAVIMAATPIQYKAETAVLGTITDITARKEMEARISASLREKEVLLQEIHHRVKNNLQVISSLLSLQADSVNNPDVMEVFRESERRIRSMAAVHEQLYRSKNLSVIDAAEYIQSVVDDVYSSYNRNARIELHTELEPIDLTIDTAIPCGLVINELLSNALKYAFPGGRGGLVTVIVRNVPADRQEGYSSELLVYDDGIGLPDDIDVWKTESLGLQLVSSLCERQLRGRLEVRRNGGTCFYLRFNAK